MSEEENLADRAEAAMTGLIGASFSGAGSSASSAPASIPEPASEVEKFEFDGEFQTKIAAHVLSDHEFMRRVGHLIDPAHFENLGEAAIVNMASKYWQRYSAVPPKSVLTTLLKDEFDSGAIRGDAKRESVEALKRLCKESLAGAVHVADKVSEFARHQAMTAAIMASVDHLGKKQFAKIEEAVKKAINTGIIDNGSEYDYFERIAERTGARTDKLAGKIPPSGISTGYAQMDDVLYHRGWGRKELAVIMGGAKAGKTTALIGFAKNAAMSGKNVLYVTLEVSAAIISDRLDANISDVMMKEIGKNILDIESKIQDARKRAGQLRIHEAAPGTFSPNQLRLLIERYESQGITFDLIVVDYADIMAPDHRYNDPIENSKSVYVGLRAVAVDKNLAILSATQTNREGFKSTVAKAEHIAEDFNKVRIVDLLISINITEEERANGEARLYFAASRNQESGFTIFIKSDISRMRFISSILRIE